MKKYNYLAKNPRFVMQDRKVTVADTANSNNGQKAIKGNEPIIQDFSSELQSKTA
jgi:hypothetical protein